MLKSRKSVQEILSFVLLLGVVITASTYAYIASKEILDEKISQKEFQRASSNLIFLSKTIKEISEFSGNRDTVKISFKKGVYKFTSEEIVYFSDLRRSVENTNSYCLDGVCERIKNYNVVKYINLSDFGVTVVTPTVTLDSGVYDVVLKNEKSSVKLEIK